MTKDIKALSPEGIQAMRELLTYQSERAMTDLTFSVDYLRDGDSRKNIGHTTWVKLRKNWETGGSYRGDTASKEVKIIEVANRLRAEAAHAARAISEASGFVEGGERGTFATLCKAIQRAHAQQGPRRIVVYLAHGGFGKTAIAEHLERGHTSRCHAIRSLGKIIRMDCTPAWKQSYGACVEAMAAKLGHVGSRRRALDAERGLLEAAKAQGRATLILDECQFLALHTTQLFTMLMNQTQMALLLLSDPTLWFHEFKKPTWRAAYQFQRRCTVLGPFLLEPADVRPLLTPLGLNGESEEAARLVADNANMTFGYGRVHEILERHADKGLPPTADGIRQAIEFCDGIHALNADDPVAAFRMPAGSKSRKR